MEKQINYIRFVALSDMTERDWRILDWDFLRNKAKNRIAAMIVAGTLNGFFHVNVLMKARAKPDYYWPTEFGDEGLDTDTADFFRREADDEFQSDDVENVDQMILENSTLPQEHLARLIIAVIGLAVVRDEVLLDEDKTRLQQMLEDLQKNGRLDTWDHLLLAIYIYRKFGVPTWESILDKIDREIEREFEVRGLIG